MTVELEIRRTFYNWLSLAEKHDLKVMAVTHSQLLTGNYDQTIFAISYKSRTTAGSHYYD